MSDIQDTPDAAPEPTEQADGPIRVELPEVLDFQATEEFAEAIEHLRDSQVEIEAGKVTFVGALFAQLLVSVQRQWVKDGVGFAVTNASDSFTKGMAALGIGEEHYALNGGSA